MARRSGFRANADFEFVISEAVMGSAASRTRAARRHRVTLQQVGQLIIEEAQRLVDAEFPGTAAGGRRNLGYDFRRGGGRTYRSSFRTRVELEHGRLILVVENTHPHAADVEFGNDPSGVIRTMRRKRGYYALPLSRTGYLRYLANQKTPRAKARKRERNRASYYTKRIDLLKQQRVGLNRKRDRLISAAGDLSAKQLKTKAHTRHENEVKDFKRRTRQYAISNARAHKQAVIANAALGGRRDNAFAKIGEDGQPYLYTKTFRTYKGYAILRRATRSVTIRTLE